MIIYLGVVPLLVAACPDDAGSTHAVEADEDDDGEYLRVGHFVRLGPFAPQLPSVRQLLCAPVTEPGS